MISKEILRKIAAIYASDPDQGRDFLNMLQKATEPDEEMLDDDIEQWLAENDPQSGEQTDSKPKEQSKQKRVRSRDWQPKENLTDQQKAKIKEHMDEGYSEREAHRFAGAHSEEADFHSAMRSGIKPSQMSSKMIEHLKDLSKEWLDNADKHEKLTADIERNPMKHAAGKMMSAHDEHLGDYKKAYNEFLASDEVKGLKGRARHEAIKNWKQQFREQNPDHQEKLAGASESGQSLTESRSAIKQSLQDKLAHIVSGGGQSSDTSYSTQEGAQHAGFSLDQEGEGATGNIKKDPMADFAAKNKKLVGMLSEEQKQRFDRINSARSVQGKQPGQSPESTQAPKPEKPKFVVRRKSDAKE